MLTSAMESFSLLTASSIRLPGIANRYSALRRPGDGSTGKPSERSAASGGGPAARGYSAGRGRPPPGAGSGRARPVKMSESERMILCPPHSGSRRSRSDCASVQRVHHDTRAMRAEQGKPPLGTGQEAIAFAAAGVVSTAKMPLFTTEYSASTPSRAKKESSAACPPRSTSRWVAWCSCRQTPRRSRLNGRMAQAPGYTVRTLPGDSEVGPAPGGTAQSNIRVVPSFRHIVVY